MTLPTFPSFLLMSIFQINSYTLFRCIAISGQDKLSASSPDPFSITFCIKDSKVAGEGEKRLCG
jgi:hypothetical protein